MVDTQGKSAENHERRSKRRYKLTHENGRERIDFLLKAHNLTLNWQIIFGRWNLCVRDVTGRELWRRRGMNLKAYRDELIEFLENYERREQQYTTTDTDVRAVGDGRTEAVSIGREQGLC